MYAMIATMVIADTNNAFSIIDKAKAFSACAPAIKGNLTLEEFMHFDEVRVFCNERIYNRILIENEKNKLKV